MRSDREAHRSDERRFLSLSEISYSRKTYFRYKDKIVWDLPDEVAWCINMRYKLALVFFTYRVVEQLSEYRWNIKENTEKVTKRMLTEIQSHTSQMLNSLRVQGFLSTCKLACDTDAIPAGSAMSFLNFSMKRSSAVVVNSSLCLKPTS